MTSTTNPLTSKTVLIVDDEQLVRDALCLLVQEHGGQPLVAGDGRDALDVLRNDVGVSCAVVDYSMPGVNGSELCEALHRERPQLPIVVVSGLGLTPDIAVLQDAGQVVFLPKPFGQVELLDAISRALELVG